MNANHPLFLEETRAFAALPLPWEKFRNKTIAVTGASGLIGSSILRFFRAAGEIHGLNLRLIALCRSPEKMPDFESIRYDALADLPEFSADFIVHAASNAHPLAFSADPVGTMQANLLGTIRLLEKIRSGGRLLFCSTGEIYGENSALESFCESSSGAIDSMLPRSCYPESKRAAETLCAAYHAQYGCDALVARLCYVFGPAITAESSRADAQFLRNALAGQDIVLKSPGAQVRSYCYIADAVSAIASLLLLGEAGQAYNIASPSGTTSIRDYAQTLADAAGVALRFDLPPDAEKQGYSTVSRAVLDSKKIQKLGWNPIYDLPTGLKHTIEISR